MLKALSASSSLHAVTKAKSNAIAYHEPKPKTGRGAKPKKGEKVSVSSLFITQAHAFHTIKTMLYDKEQEVKYYYTDLLWGMGWYQKLRFVLVVLDGKEAILVSTDLSLAPEQIISLYCRRFKIECSFRELKQVVAGFGYRFWCKSMPKLNRYIKNDENQDKLRDIDDSKARANILMTADAINRFTLLGCIALGLLQIISLLFTSAFSGSALRFMRSKSNSVPSEAAVAHFMRKNIFHLFRFFPDLSITAIISHRQLDVVQDDSLIA